MAAIASIDAEELLNDEHSTNGLFCNAKSLATFFAYLIIHFLVNPGLALSLLAEL